MQTTDHDPPSLCVILFQCADYDTPELFVDQLAQKFSFAEASAAAAARQPSESSSSMERKESYARTIDV